MQPISSSTVHHGNDVLHVVALFSSAGDINRVNIGLTRLYNAGFTVANQEAGSYRYQRFAGTDAQCIVDFQDVVADRVRMPKVLMGLRGGYGATRILSHIDFASLGTRMRERSMLFFGPSDVCTVQLALFTKGNIPNFVDPVMYSEFGKPQPSTYMMDSFVRGSTSAGSTAGVPIVQRSNVDAEGASWGGDPSVLTFLADSPYMPDIQGGILFIEDVGEQPYRTKHMLNTLCLAGVLQKQCAIAFGDFRMGTIRDIYDLNCDFPSVVSRIQRTIRVPVLIGFPFGHIANKSAFPLGAHAKIRSPGNGGYSITSGGYPTFNAATLNLSSLLPSPVTFGSYVPVGNGATEEVLEQVSRPQHRPEAV